PTRAYLVKLPSRRSINVFFYDGPVSQGIAFEKLLSSGEKFADRLAGAFDDKREWDQLVNIATDGESYGHHHRHGEMALAFALRVIEGRGVARLTNYAEFLEKFPPKREVKIHEKSSWSCSHGVGRWMTDCGCNSGGHSGWNQAWRAPLRESLDWLRDAVAPLFENKAKEFLRDPWGARDDYIFVILDRSAENREKFFREHATHELNDGEKVAVLKLMELQRHAMLMYTSCGWFFDELSGIETVQVIQYAARVLQLANEIFGQDLEPRFLERLERAKSNIPENQNGRVVYEKFARPAMIDHRKAIAHYAISSVFHDYPDRLRIFSFTFQDEHREQFTAGKTRLAIGRTKVISEITLESETLAYAIHYMGEHNVIGGVGSFDSEEKYDLMFREIKTAYESADFPEIIHLIDRHFGKSAYSLKSLFKDEQRRIIGDILGSTREDIENRFRLIAERYTPLMKFLQSAGAPAPQELQSVLDLILHSDLRRQFKAEQPDIERLRALIEEAKPRGPQVLDVEISFVAKHFLERAIQKIAEHPDEAEPMRMLEQVAALVMPLPIGLDVGRTQNTYWSLTQTALPDLRRRAEGGAKAKEALDAFLALGRRLGFAPCALEPEAADAKKDRQ
ncbi:MAG TPA: DUF3536 domain-containing protein, partial [Verrucomicrobiae bacterium]|nr:DUF3536 domain-containing protein [Verrucomicrobiae bacterium]